MQNSSQLLVITASNGENLKLAKRFVNSGNQMDIKSELIDLTALDLPLYNPRTHEKEGIPELAKILNKQLSAIPRWIICAPEYNGSIPPVLTSSIAWLSVQGDDFRSLFNGRPIAIASHSGGGGMELLISLRVQLSHLGSLVIGRQLMSNYKKPASDESIDEIIKLLAQVDPLDS